jgi:AcrR family transcriptional regulator
MAKNSSTTARKPRTDALRNRERILEIAKAAFTRLGATASLEEIAKMAGVGIGTLYRHFPTRDALIEGVYRNEVEKLAAAASRFAQKTSLRPRSIPLPEERPGYMKVHAPSSRMRSVSWSSAPREVVICA